MNNENKTEHGGMFGLGEPNTGFAKYFIGNSYLNPLTKPGESPIFIANVTFEPACRNNWHIHHASTGGGQILICVDGEGWIIFNLIKCILRRYKDVIFRRRNKKIRIWINEITYER